LPQVPDKRKPQFRTSRGLTRKAFWRERESAKQNAWKTIAKSL
jgi:hypothetical protein